MGSIGGGRRRQHYCQYHAVEGRWKWPAVTNTEEEVQGKGVCSPV